MSRLTQRLFAAIYDPALAPTEKRTYGPLREYVAGGAAGRVLEIGAGTGANLPFYPGDIDLTVSDPNPFMLRRLKSKADTSGRTLNVIESRSDVIPAGDGAFDTIVATLVLCSVDGQDATLAEITRLLRPGGEFRFMEHVRGDGLIRGRFQDAMTPVWSTLFEGCHPNRNTMAAIRRSGLEVVETRTFGTGPYPVRPHVAGFAVKPRD